MIGTSGKLSAYDPGGSKLLENREVHALWSTDLAKGRGSLQFQSRWRRKPQGQQRRSRSSPSAILSPEKDVDTGSASKSGGSGGREDFGRSEREERTASLLRPLKPRGSVTQGEQQIVLDSYDVLQDSDSESDRDEGVSDAPGGRTKRKKVDPEEVSARSSVEAYQSEVKKAGSQNGIAPVKRSEDNSGTGRNVGAADDSKPSKKVEVKEGQGNKVRRFRVGKSLQRANGAVKVVRDKSESTLSELVARLTDALEKVVGGGRIGGVPVARVIAKGVSGAVKGGAAASMAESVGMHVGGGQLEVAALRGAMTGAIADVVSLFIDPPAQELGEDAVEKGEQAAEELEERLRAKSGGTMIIKRAETTDGRMGKILSVEKKDSGRKTKRKQDAKDQSEKGGSKETDEEGGNKKGVVRSDATASEGVKEEGQVWGQMEERQSTTAVTVVGNAVDLGAKALGGAMKGAIWGAAQEAANNGFIPHGVARGAISGAFGDTIASRVDPLAQKSQESINGHEKKDNEKKAKGTIQRKVEGAKEIAQTEVLRPTEEGVAEAENGGGKGGREEGKIEGGTMRKEDEVVETNQTRGCKEVRVRSGATLQVVAKKYRKVGEGGKVEEVPFPSESELAGGKETRQKVGMDLEVAVRGRNEGDFVAGGSVEKEGTLVAADASFRAGLEAVGDDVIPQEQVPADVMDYHTSSKSKGEGEQGAKEFEETESSTQKGPEVPGELELGSRNGEKEGRKVTGAQLARPQSRSVDGVRVESGHWSPDLVFETGFGGSDVVIDHPRLAERIEAEEGVGLEVEGAVDNPVSEQLSLLNEKGVQMKKQEKGFWTEEQQAEAEKTALRKLTRALGGAVKGAATGAMTEMATTGTFSGIGAVKGAVGGAVADLAADVADPIAEQVGKDSDSEEDSTADEDSDADVGVDGESDMEVEAEADVAGDRLEVKASATQSG